MTPPTSKSSSGVPSGTCSGSIAAQIADASAALERHLPGSLIGLYLYGSAVAGGLKPRSDIDLMACVAAAPDPGTRRDLMRSLLAVSAPPGSHPRLRPLEVTIIVLDEVVPWRYPPTRQMQFGEWLREDIESGIFEPAMADPDLAILLATLRNDNVRLKGPPAATLFDPVPSSDVTQAFVDTIGQWRSAEDWQGDEKTVVLALARIWFSARNGGVIVPKDVAAAWVLSRLPEAHRPILRMACAAYLGEAEDRLGDHPVEMAAFVAIARRKIENALSVRAGSHVNRGSPVDRTDLR